MLYRPKEAIQKELSLLTSKREILRNGLPWLLATGSMWLVSPELSVAMLLAYGIISGEKVLEARRKRIQLRRELATNIPN